MPSRTGKLSTNGIISEMPLHHHLLRIDASGGLIVGTAVLAAFPLLQPLFAMPTWMLATMGLANVAYGCFSFSLARRTIRPPALIMTLIIANGTWSVLCVIAAIAIASDASWIGIAHLLSEAAIVGTLAVLEWNSRVLLRTALPS